MKFSTDPPTKPSRVQPKKVPLGHLFEMSPRSFFAVYSKKQNLDRGQWVTQTEKENDPSGNEPAVKQSSINSLIIKKDTVKADIRWVLESFSQRVRKLP